jgi:hypothetical protein
MYGLPADFDASIFVGKRLESVCFYEFSVGFSFDPEAYVQTEWGFNYSVGPNEPSHFQAIPATDSGAIRLLGFTITAGEAHPDGTLTLVFDDGSVLQFLDSGPQYESYQIKLGDREIIV